MINKAILLKLKGGKMAKLFHPGPRCGNCHFYNKKSDNYHSGRFCRLEVDPRECGIEFRPRAGRPRKTRKVKPWQKNGISHNTREALNDQKNRKKTH